MAAREGHGWHWQDRMYLSLCSCSVLACMIPTSGFLIRESSQVLKQTVHRECFSEKVFTDAMWQAGPRLRSQLHSLLAMPP